jgi:general secretion pathway protein A
MYTAYFGFREEPFGLTPTSRLFYTNPVYEEAYTKLLEGINKRKGFIMLTGEVGTGKTTLLRRLINTLNTDPTVSVLFSSYSILTFAELLSFICADLGLGGNEEKHPQDMPVLSKFLRARSQKGGTTALLIDEAQDLEEEALENLQLLSYSRIGGEKLLQIILAGQQPELEEKLSQPSLHHLKQCIAVRCQLEHLKTTEVKEFIQHRLRLVGYERQDLFCPEAIQLIALYSTGIPRLINLLCDNALRATYETAQKTVSAEVVQKVAHHLRLKQESTARHAAGREKRTLGEALQLLRTKLGEYTPRLSASLKGTGILLALLGMIVLTVRVGEQLGIQTSEKESASSSHVVRLSISEYALRGKTILKDLMDRNQEVRPMVWGLATASPAIALLIPETTWSKLSKEDQVSLTWYLESLIPSVRTHPDQYIEEFYGAPVYEMFRTKIAGLCGDCWVIGLSHLTGDTKNLLFDKVIVQGDSLWKKAPPYSRGVKASAFRVELKASPNKPLEGKAGQR